MNSNNTYLRKVKTTVSIYHQCSSSHNHTSRHLKLAFLPSKFTLNIVHIWLIPRLLSPTTSLKVVQIANLLTWKCHRATWARECHMPAQSPYTRQAKCEWLLQLGLFTVKSCLELVVPHQTRLRQALRVTSIHPKDPCCQAPEDKEVELQRERLKCLWEVDALLL